MVSGLIEMGDTNSLACASMLHRTMESWMTLPSACIRIDKGGERDWKRQKWAHFSLKFGLVLNIIMRILRYCYH